MLFFITRFLVVSALCILFLIKVVSWMISVFYVERRRCDGFFYLLLPCQLHSPISVLANKPKGFLPFIFSSQWFHGSVAFLYGVLSVKRSQTWQNVINLNGRASCHKHMFKEIALITWVSPTSEPPPTIQRITYLHKLALFYASVFWHFWWIPGQ